MSGRQTRITSKPVSYNEDMASDNARMGLEPFPKAIVTADMGNRSILNGPPPPPKAADGTAPEPPPPPLGTVGAASTIHNSTDDNHILSSRMDQEATDGRASPAPSLRAGATAQNFQQVSGASTIGSITSSLSGHNLETLETLSQFNKPAFHAISDKIIKKYSAFSRGLKNVPKEFELVVLSVDTTKVGLETLDMFLQVLEKLDESEDEHGVIETQKVTILGIQASLNAYLTEFESLITQKELNDQVERSKKDPNYLPPSWGEESLDTIGSHAEGETMVPRGTGTYSDHASNRATDTTGSHAQGDTVVPENSNIQPPVGDVHNSVKTHNSSLAISAGDTAHSDRPVVTGQVSSYKEPSYYHLTFGVEPNPSVGDTGADGQSSTNPTGNEIRDYSNFGARPKIVSDGINKVNTTVPGPSLDQQGRAQALGQPSYQEIQVQQQQILQGQHVQANRTTVPHPQGTNGTRPNHPRVQDHVQVHTREAEQTNELQQIPEQAVVHGGQVPERQQPRLGAIVHSAQVSAPTNHVPHNSIQNAQIEQQQILHLPTVANDHRDQRPAPIGHQLQPEQISAPQHQPTFRGGQNVGVQQQHVLPQRIDNQGHSGLTQIRENNVLPQQSHVPQVTLQRLHQTTQVQNLHNNMQGAPVNLPQEYCSPYGAHSTPSQQQRQVPLMQQLINDQQKEQVQSIQNRVSIELPRQPYNSAHPCTEQVRQIPQVQTHHSTGQGQGQTLQNGMFQVNTGHQIDPRLEVYHANPNLYMNSTAQQNLSLISNGQEHPQHTGRQPNQVQHELHNSYIGSNPQSETRSSDWKEYHYQGNNIQAIMLNDTMAKIQEIVDNPPSQSTPDLMIKAMDKRDVPLLKELRSTIMKACKDMKLENEDPRLSQFAAEAFRAAGKYIDAVDKQIRTRGLHIIPDNKKADPLQLKKFDGFKSSDTNIYEFLQNFEVVTRGMLEHDLKEYLFQNYLSDDLQNEVRHLRHSFQLMKNALIKRYGNLNTLIREKKTQLKALSQPNFKSSKSVKADFLKGFKEVLDQLKTLVILNKEKYPEMEREIYNSNRVMELASLLPDYYKSLFTQTLIEESNLKFEGEDLPGEDIFNLLVKFLRDQARMLEISISSLSTGDEKADDTANRKKTVNYAGGSKTDQKGTKTNKGNDNSSTKRTYDPSKDTWRVACCFMHPHIIRKVSDCLSGKCDLFLQAHPSERNRMAVKKGICTLCFLFKCKKKAPNGPCKYKQEMPKTLICQPCALNKTDTNVLMCSDHKNDSKQVRKDLVKFLPGFEETTSIQIFMMGTYAPNAPIVLKSAEHTAPTFKVRENDDAFNLTDGTTVPQQDILHKIHSETKHNPMYLLQTLSFAGTPVLTLYDTGASGECIKVEVAEKCKLAIVDPTPQYICVATGSVVPTGGCIYKAVIGPDTNGHYHSVTMTGMSRITEKIPNYDLSEMITDFQTNQMSTPLSKEKLPLNAGGDEVGMIIGIKQSRLIPNLELVLPNGLQVWRSRMKDIYDSDLIFSGPHYSVTEQDRVSAGSSRINIMFASLYNSYKDSMYSDFLLHQGEQKTCLSSTLQHQHTLHLPTPVGTMEGSQAEDPACHKHDIELLKDGCTCTTLNTMVDHCACCTPDTIKKAETEKCSPVNLHLLSTKERHSIKPLETEYIEEIKDESEPIFVPEFNEKLLFVHLGVPVVHEATTVNEKNALQGIATCRSQTDPPEVLKARVPKTIEQGLQEQEEAGCKVDFRCPDCQDCTACKASDKTRDTAVRDILDDQVIDSTITIDTETQTTFCSYPWVKDPDKYLKEKWHGRSDNKHVALKVFEQQTLKSEKIRKGTLEFHKEILEKGFATKLSDLPSSEQIEITSAPLLHFFIWRTMEKPTSQSTPIRMVVDPSMSHFNDTIAKGSSCLNSLYQIMINWRSYLHVFTSDLSKMYNTIKLTKPMYRYSLYLFSENLLPGEEPEIYVMTTLFYGLKSAANICTSSLRKVAAMKEDSHPKGAAVLKKLTYMDDSGQGANTREALDEIIEEVKDILPLGGFKLKVVCKSGEDPPETASPDGVTSTFCGYCWHVKEDLLSLNHGTINFNVKRRGAKKPYDFPVETDEEVENLLTTQKLTRRKLLGKCLEVYDLLGIFEPLKARLKLDLQLLKTLDYDEEIPIEQRPRWEDNLKIINNARHLRCRRAVVPKNAVNPDQMHLICCSDAAKDMAGAAIYARFLLKDQTYSVQLITGKSRTVNSTIPRNELEAALLAAETFFVLSKALEDRITSYMLVIDSEVALYWISNLEIKLKSFVFNRVRSIHRLVSHDRFFHVKGEDNPSDILTRGNVNLEDLSQDSRWFNGDPWMRLPEEQMIKDQKIRSPDSIRSKISEDYSEDINREMVRPFMEVNQVSSVDTLIEHSEILVLSEQGCIEGRNLNLNQHPTDMSAGIYRTENKELSNTLQSPCARFILDPVHYGFKHTLYTIALVYRFITRTRHAAHVKKELHMSTCHLCELQDKLFKDDGLKRVDTSDRSQLPAAPCLPSSYDIRNAWRFLCLAASTEVREVYTPKKLEPFLDDGTGILKSGGRLSYPDLAQDHSSLPYFQDISFVNPVALYTSKLTLSLCIHMHWDILHHPGVERQISQMLKVLHVPKLRTLVKKYRENCPRCRYLLKKRFSASTGNQTKLALLKCPPFYATMIDIAGTFLAFDVKSRTTKDAFMLVFNCLTTSAVNIHCMEDTTAESIVMAITRHSKSYGYSKYLLPDNQSSFSTLENLRISFRDLQCRLWNNQRIILDFSTPLAHAEHGKVESRIKVLKNILESTAELGRRHSFLQWESVAASITSTMNNLPITHCMDSADLNHDLFGFITPNNMLIGRNQDRAPEGPVDLEAKPSKLLQNIADLNEAMQEILANNIHRYVPGKQVYQGQLPTVGDVCLFLHKENQRSRNCKYKYGRIAAVNVDGRPNKIRIQYRNASEVNHREVDRNIKDVVLIQSINDVDFNNPESWIAQEAQRRYLFYTSMR